MGSMIMSNIGEWFELESDPGLFTLLCEEFKVTGVEVEEIYELEKPFDFDAFGFIFLFKWTDERKARRNRCYGANDSADKNTSATSPNVTSSASDHNQANNISSNSGNAEVNVNSANTSCGSFVDEGSRSATGKEEEELFFAHQIVTNSCATHALLSILLNCGSCPNVHLGDLLVDFREFTRKLSPEDRGYAIGSSPRLVEIHNRHARHERRNAPSSMSSKPSPTLPNGTACIQKQEDSDAFHYVSFVNVNGRLMELDGLRELPIDHGPLPTDGPFWTEHFRNLIRKRVGLERENSNVDSSSNDVHPEDIRYNLMAVVPDKRVILSNKMDILRTNMDTIQKTVDELVSRCGREKSMDEVKGEPSDCNLSNSPDLRNDEAEGQLMVLSELIDKIKDSPLKVSVTQVVETGNGDRPLMQPCTTVASTDITKPLHIAVADVAAMTAEMLNTTPSKSGTAVSSSGGPSQTTQANSASPTYVSGAPARELTTPNTTTTFSPSPSPSSLGSASTSRSKYSTRSSTRLNTLASNSLANARNDGNSILSDRISAHKGFSPEELLELAQAVIDAIRECEVQLREQESKREKYWIDDSRRRHDYSEFIHTFVHMLMESGRWSEVEMQQRAKENRDQKDVSCDNQRSYDSEMRARPRRNVRRKNCRPLSDLRKMKYRSVDPSKITVPLPILIKKENKGRPHHQVLVIWDDPSEGLCNYIKIAHLGLVESDTLACGSKVVYRDNLREWTGRIPRNFAEVEEVCASESAAIEMRFDGERQFLVMWDKTTEGVCDYVDAHMLKVIDGSTKISRGTRVSMMWNKEEWFGRVPPVGH